MLESLVEEFLARDKMCDCFSDLRSFESLDLSHAVNKACLSTFEGKRHPHQRHLTRATLLQSRDALLNLANGLAACTTFDGLHRKIEVAMAPIKGAGPLYIYDVAHRIGVSKQLEPELVYLHAGAHIGARRLGISGNKVPIESTPKALQVLSAAQIEDFLCLYKDRFG